MNEAVNVCDTLHVGWCVHVYWMRAMWALYQAFNAGMNDEHHIQGHCDSKMIKHTGDDNHTKQKPNKYNNNNNYKS